ncbi:transcriptional regulator, TyrR [Ferrimonas balearica DSM 9799]|uniref:HTH-type transcriptional regulatory protein TyrR n=1 Tax=Ferrimonas balearica (strain DSM 9799 / CCM 4581 / KCTC 23876 / PAT) TaxID=550540 RepID=E1SPG3_FERBD|nr:transcriptional regulator TyrR [Ferrimonas balearica]ADN76780.1 transcriptional regulator, TyrR [Ferrimonas balearica DSM 9799]
MRLQVSCEDRIGLAREILEVLEKQNININAIDAGSAGYVFLQIPAPSFEELQILMPMIRKIPGVTDVKTVPFMPSEREHYAMEALLRTLPDPIFAIDLKGRISMANDSILSLLGLPREQVMEEPVSNWIQGFSFLRWLGLDEVLPQATRVSVQGNQYLAEILPIDLPDEEGTSILAGAMVLLKSPARVGKQFNALRDQISGFDTLLAESDKMRALLAEARRMAQLEAPLLVTGETGTGKELLARACHEASLRQDKSFVVINCASLPDSVAESELFGLCKSPGEVVKRGVIEQADGGTVFLDEVADMSPQLQVKLLRLIQDGCFRRVGDDTEIRVDLRVICASQRDLSELCQRGDFREDLYYRINVLNLHLPPLRERKADIVPLAELFLEHYSQQLASPLRQLSAECREFMKNYAWPGNVRQLKNAIFRAVSMADERGDLTPEQLRLPSWTEGFGYFDQEFEGTLDEAVKQFEASLLRRLYPAYPSTRQLARKLGVSHTAIANKLREHGIGKTRK